jgi:hypothetical protein
MQKQTNTTFAFILDIIYNCISNLDFVKTKITFLLFLETYFSFILHIKIHLAAILTKTYISYFYFLKLQFKIFFLNLIFKAIITKAIKTSNTC